MPRYTLETVGPLSQSTIDKIVKLASPRVPDNNPDGAGLIMTTKQATLKPEAKTLHIIGRRWFQKSYGNTYHTVEVWIDGRKVFKSERQYGYGDQYLTTAVHWLQQSGHLPADIIGHSGTRYLREESGFAFSYECHDVQRQKDL